MIHVVARISAKQGHAPELLTAFKELLPAVHIEKGCISYVPTIDLATDIDRQGPVNSDTITIIEKWESLDHLKAHLVAPHMQNFRDHVGAIVSETDLRILEER